MKQTVETKNERETFMLGEKIGKQLRGGEVFELRSDLGGGKTTLVRGLVAGLGSDDAVASPTFTISKRYDSPRSTIYHYDFYRLAEAGLVAEELAEGFEDASGITIVEWADTVNEALPEQRIIITLHKQADSNEHRKVEFLIPDELDYVVREMF